MSNFPATQPTLVMPFSGMDTPTRMNQLLDSWGATFTRATTATFRNKLGLRESVASGLPRPNFDRDTKENKGILIEEARTNEALHSADLTNAVWTKTNGTATKDQIGDDGVADSASLFTATSANATVLQSFTDATSQERTYSVEIKRSVGTGTVEITIDGGSTWTDVTSNLSTSSFYKAEVTATGTNPSIGIRVVTSGDAVIVDANQLENGDFSTSHIPTTTSTVTRNADECSISSTAFSDFYNQSEGTFLIDVEVVGETTEALRGGLLTISNGLGNERFGFYYDQQDILAYTRDNLASDNIEVTNNVNKTKATIVYNRSNSLLDVYGDGSRIGGLDISRFSTHIFDRLDLIGSVGGTGYLNAPSNMYVKRLAYYPSALTDAQLQKLTRST